MFALVLGYSRARVLITSFPFQPKHYFASPSNEYFILLYSRGVPQNFLSVRVRFIPTLHRAGIYRRAGNKEGTKGVDMSGYEYHM